jgi:hypothetical protein
MEGNRRKETHEEDRTGKKNTLGIQTGVQTQSIGKNERDRVEDKEKDEKLGRYRGRDGQKDTERERAKRGTEGKAHICRETERETKKGKREETERET